MKSFKNYITEDGVNTTQQSPSIDGTDINPAALENPSVVRALNAYVGAIANMEYIQPEQALSKLRSALDRVGYSFGAIPEMTEQSGSFDLPLTRFGGRFGKDTDTPHDEVISDDGISHMVEGGLALKIQYEMMRNNSCRIFAKIE